MPRRVLQVIGYSLVVLAIVAASANSLIRLGSDDDESYGIVEQWVLGRSAKAAIARMLHSGAFRHWDDATKLSGELARLIADSGPRLVVDARLADERTRLAVLARTALHSASAIPDSYLAASNPDLPSQYKTHFVESMRLFAEGLERSDQTRILDGIDHYNAFIRWIQARNRSDFKPMK